MDKKVFRDISYGMYIVATKDRENKNVGCVINTLTQITSTDLIISISLNKENYTNKAIKANKIFSISILSVDTPKEVIGTFGYHSSKEHCLPFRKLCTAATLFSSPVNTMQSPAYSSA